MSREEHYYSTLYDVVEELKSRGFSKRQIKNIASHANLDECSYGSQRLSHRIGGYVNGILSGGLLSAFTFMAFSSANHHNESNEPLTYMFTAAAFLIPFLTAAADAAENLNIDDEKLYQHLKAKFPQVASDVESVAKARFDSKQSALEKRLYTPAISQ